MISVDLLPTIFVCASILRALNSRTFVVFAILCVQHFTARYFFCHGCIAFFFVKIIYPYSECSLTKHIHTQNMYTQFRQFAFVVVIYFALSHMYNTYLHWNSAKIFLAAFLAGIMFFCRSSVICFSQLLVYHRFLIYMKVYKTIWCKTNLTKCDFRVQSPSLLIKPSCACSHCYN